MPALTPTTGRAGLGTAAATVFLDKAGEEQRSTFYTVAEELRMSYQITKKKLVQAGPAKKLPKWWNAISRAVFSSWKLKF